MILWRHYYQNQMLTFKRNRIRGIMGFIYLMQVIHQGIKSGIINFRSELRLHISCTWMRCANYQKNRRQLMGMTLTYENMSQVLRLLLFLKLDSLHIILILLLHLLINKMCFQSYNFSLRLGDKIHLNSSQNKN